MATKIVGATVILVLACHFLPGLAALSDDEKQEILSAHNRYRRRVNPIATNMAKLEWDDELASLAQFWAVNCEMAENENRHDQSTAYDYIGETLGATRNYSIDYVKIVSTWFNQGSMFNYDSATCTDEDGNEEEEGCQFYTQLVWASTYKVGCGVFLCEELMGWDDEDEDDDNDDDSAYLVVCDYGPGGAFAGEQPYQTGSQVCSACPSDRSLCQNGLCADSGAPAQVSMAILLLVLAAISSLL